MSSLILRSAQILTLCSNKIFYVPRIFIFFFLLFLVYSSVFMSYKLLKGRNLIFLLHLCLPRVWTQNSFNKYLLNQWVILSNVAKIYKFW